MSGNFFVDLQDAFIRTPEAICLYLEDGNNLTYGALAERTACMARVLAELGVSSGERVVAQVGKSPESLLLYLATLQLGGVYVPLNTAYTPAEVEYFLKDATPALFVTDGQVTDEVATGGSNTQYITQWQHRQLPKLASMSRRVAPHTSVAERSPDDLAAILYTSGTTGRSKGAMLTHRNLQSNAHALVACWGWRADDVLLHALPTFHVHGLFIALHCALLSATPVIFLPQFNTKSMLEWMPQATVMMGVPTFYTRLLAEAGLTEGLVKHMRVFISGSAPLTEQTFADWEARTGHRILERYGMSETIINTSNPLVGERVPGTVGYALPGVEVRIADADGHALATGEIGMIEVRGENVCAGYWQMPEKTREEFREDGFFITGDLGRMDADGRLSIVGRGKDLVISGGYNVYPKEVEGVLDALPGVKESAVIGVPHPDFGEAVVAVVVLDESASAEPGDKSVAAVTDPEWLRETLHSTLARFKQPKRVIAVAELPRNTMGKVQKNILRETYKDLFN